VTELLPFLVVGVFTGSLYGLAAMGLVLTYRTSGTFNFGHGGIAAGAAFFFYSLRVNHGWSWPFAAAATVILFALVGGTVLELVTRGLGDVPSVVSIVATIGILLATQGVLYLIYGDDTRIFPEFLPTSGFTISGVSITWSQVISVTIAATCAAGLYAFLRFSKLGVSMRAVVDNTTLTELTGESAGRIRWVSWTIGAGFAAMSGILLAPTLGLDPALLSFLVVQAFGAAAIGRFSSLPMTYVGGFVVGVAASLATRYFTSQSLSGLPSTVPFLVLIVVLLLLPARSLPRQTSVGRNLIAEPLRLPVRVKVIGATLMLGAAVMVPRVVGSRIPLWISAMTYVILFGSLALLVWVSGQISACHMAFAALGVTNMAHFSPHMPWLAAVILAGVATVPVGALVAIPALRLSGLYLALITLGFGVLMQNVLFPSSWMFSTHLRVTAERPTFLGINGSDDGTYYYVVLSFAIASLAVIAMIYRGRLGRLLRAMSETPTMLTTHGLSVAICRLLVFCFSAFLAGLAGALSLAQTGSASGVSYGPVQSLLLLAVLAVSGVRLLSSAVVAALLLAVLPGYLSAVGIEQFGVNRQILAFGLTALIASLLLAHRAAIRGWCDLQLAVHAERARRSPVRARARQVAARRVPALGGER
jgi:branched-subunit amino acid ABC-type transport system permease component